MCGLGLRRGLGHDAHCLGLHLQPTQAAGLCAKVMSLCVPLNGEPRMMVSAGLLRKHPLHMDLVGGSECLFDLMRVQCWLEREHSTCPPDIWWPSQLHPAGLTKMSCLPPVLRHSDVMLALGCWLLGSLMLVLMTSIVVHGLGQIADRLPSRARIGDGVGSHPPGA